MHVCLRLDVVVAVVDWCSLSDVCVFVCVCVLQPVEGMRLEDVKQMTMGREGSTCTLQMIRGTEKYQVHMPVRERMRVCARACVRALAGAGFCPFLCGLCACLLGSRVNE